MLLNRKIYLILLLIIGISNAQKKIDIRYYVNNTQFPISEVSVYLVTKFDTIIPTIIDGKINLQKKMKDNFTLYTNIKGDIIKIGSYRPKDFEQIDAIAIGRITDFTLLEQSWQDNNTYKIDKEYAIMIPDAERIADVIYCIIRKDVDVSLISNFAKYYPTYSGSYEVIKKM